MKMNEKYMWILDAANGSVFKFEIPRHFPENGDYEKLVMSILPKGVRIQDCSWQEATSDVQVLNSRENGQYW
tara:strand:- start:65 stop:280 length:216 start_codon:yes stop_codon:yes gene_type:complete